MTVPTIDPFRRIVWPLAIAQIFVWAAMYYLSPALLLEWEGELGWSKTELSGAFTMALVVSAALAPVVGRIIDRGFGSRIFIGSAVLGSLLLVLLSMVTKLWQFYTVWILIGMAMSGGLYEACFAILTGVMGNRVKQAITLVTLVAGFAGTLAFPGTHALVGIFGWRGTVLSFAAAIILIATPLIWSGCRFSERHAETHAVIHAAAQSEPNLCQENRDTSYRINTEVAINIARFCSDLEIPCLFISSDLVFDGLNPPYSEEDEPSPLNVYGEHKLMAEIGMKNQCASIVICRMPLMFGSSGPTGSSFLQPLLRQMRLGMEVNLFVDEFRTPLSGENAVEGLMLALEKLPDVIHLGGLERISRYEFGKLVMDVFNFRNAKLNPCRQKEIQMAAPRPRDVSLTSAKAMKMGFQLDPVKLSLECIKAVDKLFLY